MEAPLRGLLPPTLTRELIPPVTVHPAIKISDVVDETGAHDEVVVAAARGPVVEVVEAE